MDDNDFKNIVTSLDCIQTALNIENHEKILSCLLHV